METNNTSRNSPFAPELYEIEDVRKANPNVGPYVLARQIKAGKFGSQARIVSAYRSYYSILSVIRRYDARQIKATVAA